MTRTLLLNWYKDKEIIGGSEVIFSHLAEMFHTKVISAEEASAYMGLPYYREHYVHATIDRAIVFDKFIEKYENEYDLIIRNSCCGCFYKPKIPTINLFQDQSKWIGEVMQKNGFERALFDLITTPPLLQKLCGETGINVANSNFMKQYLDEIGVKCHHVIELGADTDFFKPIADMIKPEWTNNYKHIGLWVGKFHFNKYNLIPEIITANPDILWILVFSGDVKKKVFASNVVVYQDLPPSALQQLYLIADFTINTSLYESFSLTSVESASCNTPIIINRTGIVWDWWDERLGERVEEYSVEKYLEAIIKIMSFRENMD